MKNFLLTIGLMFAVSGYAQDTKRCEGVEPTYLNRLPGFYVSDCRHSDFNEKEFIYYVKGNAIKLVKAGVYREVWYTLSPGETRRYSGAQAIANYSEAFLKVKGKLLSDDKTFMTATLNNKNVYLQLEASKHSTDIKSYHFYIIEEAAMQQDIVVDLKEAIDREGKVAIYGILFDVGKSDIKPESAAAIAKITDYLNANPAVKIIVVGHTDNTGTYANNIALSKARAESVKEYLIKTGKISAARLMTEGAGQYCPVSTNDNEDGRKQNRRVEIVKQ